VALAGAVSYLAMGVMAWRTLQKVDAGQIAVGIDEDALD
jgi:hypothetical protein